MKMTPLEKRVARRQRNTSMVDLNLVSLIDIFTILIFFLLANASDVEILPSAKAVRLPESTAEKAPKETVVVVVNNEDIVVQGLKVASVPDVMQMPNDLIPALKSELELHTANTVLKTDAQDPKGKAVTIMGDKEIPYRLLRKIMVTCAVANYSNISFAVSKKSKG